MKASILLLIVLISCSFQEEPSYISEQKDEIAYEEFSVDVKILGRFPIGWGTSYRCEIISIHEGFAPKIDSTFTVKVAIGDDLLNLDEDKMTLSFRGTFQLSEEGYSPSGLSGMMDKDNFIWSLKRVETFTVED